MTGRISSRQNAKIKLARALRTRKERRASGLYLVEGIWHVGEALAAGASIEFLLYAPELLNSAQASRFIEDAGKKGIPTYASSAEAFASAGGKEHPQGLLAIVQQQKTTLQDLTPERFAWGVAVVAPQDPGNIGTILRSIDAVGAGGLVILDGGADPYHHTSVRAGMGAHFWHPLVQTSFEDFAKWAQRHGYQIYGSSKGGEDNFLDVEYEQPSILLLGNERTGLAEKHKAICKEVVSIPMQGQVTSLNLAVAASVLLYAMQSQFSKV